MITIVEGLMNNMKFPILYKKTNTGAIQFWEIETIPQHVSCGDASVIVTTYGQLGTDSPQTTKDIVDQGKNIGKANETSAHEQAELEAKAKWEKQKKKGYVESIEAAEAGELDELIEGGISPMLAHTFEKQGHKIKYPAYIQPKLDGIRCIAIVKDGKCTLWSRTRKPITSCPHIVEEIEKNFKEDIVLDGELYNHIFKDNFEHIVHLVRQEEPDPQCTDVQYHVYDMVDSNTFENRVGHLTKCFTIGNPKFEYLKLVPTHGVQCEEGIVVFFESFVNRGYEGCMLRNSDGLYVNKRSYDLIKVKEMLDDEFEIVGIEEGRGKLSGHVGAFVCKTKDGQEFKAKPAGATERLREYFLDHSLWEGRQLVVQFQDLTSYGIPRFPVGLRLKEQI
jgi:DNA ligase 1